MLTKAWRLLFGPKVPSPKDSRAIAGMPVWNSFMSYYKDKDGCWQVVGCYTSAEEAWKSLEKVVLPLSRKMVLRAVPWRENEKLKGL